MMAHGNEDAINATSAPAPPRHPSDGGAEREQIRAGCETRQPESELELAFVDPSPTIDDLLVKYGDCRATAAERRVGVAPEDAEQLRESWFRLLRFGSLHRYLQGYQ